MMRKQAAWRRVGMLGTGISCLAWSGCASVEPKAAKPGFDAPAEADRSVAPATTVAPPPEGYDWDTLARMAAESCGEAKALLLEAQAERHQTAVDTGWREPQLRYGHDWGDQDELTPGRTGMRTYPGEVNAPARPFTRYGGRDVGSSDGETVGVRVYAANPFVNRWLRRRGAASARALETESEEEAYAVFCEVRTLCLEAELLREETALLERMAEVRVELCDVLREQADAGVSSPLDLIRAETRLASLQSEICGKRTARQQFVRRIAVLSGMPAEQVTLRPRTSTRPLAPSHLDPAVLTDLAFLRRPDLARLEHEREAAEHGAKAARAGRIPWLEYVEGTYEDGTSRTDGYENDVSGHDRTVQDETEWQVRIAVTVPVFNWLGDQVKLTQAQLAAAETRVRGRYETVRSEVGGALADYRSASSACDRLSGERARLCAATEARVDALAREPTIKREEVLAAREELLAYRRACLRAERECLLMAQYLETVSGGSLATAR